MALAITIVLLFALFMICLLTISVIFLIKRRRVLLDERDYYKRSFDNATTEINRLALILIKMKRDKKIDNIELDLDKILDKIQDVGYNNLTYQEKNFLNKQ